MNLVSRKELARRAGVTPAAITKACRGRLKGAVSGLAVDADHPDALAYVSQVSPQRTKTQQRDREAERAELDDFDDRVLAALQRLVAGARRARRGSK